jgi:hypothetical protein
MLPVLTNILVIDIIMDRDSGIWSRAKQGYAEIAIAVRKACKKLKTKAVHRLGAKNRNIVKTPLPKAPTTVIDLVPNLFPSLPVNNIIH